MHCKQCQEALDALMGFLLQTRQQYRQWSVIVRDITKCNRIWISSIMTTILNLVLTSFKLANLDALAIALSLSASTQA